jgi:hypothetical protein
MAVNDYIKIDTSTTTAIHAQKLKEGIRQLRNAVDTLVFIRKMMEHMTDESDFALIELLFGLEAGKGSIVYNLVNGAVGNAQKNLTEQVG